MSAALSESWVRCVSMYLQHAEQLQPILATSACRSSCLVVSGSLVVLYCATSALVDKSDRHDLVLQHSLTQCVCELSSLAASLIRTSSDAQLQSAAARQLNSTQLSTE